MRSLLDHHRAEAARGRLAYQSCPSCGAVQAVPRNFCHRCGARDPEWRVSEGRGTVAAVTTLNRAPTPAYRERVPYGIVLVDLAEGYRVMGHAEPGLAVGDRVVADHGPVEDRNLLRFRPA
jgi:uncharacterized protein